MMEEKGAVSVRVILFSPTGGTRKIARRMAGGLADRSVWTDVTLPRERQDVLDQGSSGGEIAGGIGGGIAVEEDAVLLAAPVYEERCPRPFREVLSCFRAEGKPVFLLSVYGQVGYGLSLRDLAAAARAMGGRPEGAAAFLGEHSFAREDVPLAAGRPDKEDLSLAEAWGRRCRARLSGGAAAGGGTAGRDMDVPGRLPLLGWFLSPGGSALVARAPQIRGDGCIRCGVCADVCPAGAIERQTFQADPSSCLRCYACSRACPEGIRPVRYRFTPVVKAFLNSHGRRRREPLIVPEEMDPRQSFEE